MTWSRTKLERVVHGRLTKLGKLQPVEKAALAYARWQGLTDETDIDVDAAKRALDKALLELDAREPIEAWSDLTMLAEELGDEVVIGLMRYSVQRGAEQVRDQAHEVQEPEPPVDIKTPGKKRPKDRAK